MTKGLPALLAGAVLASGCVATAPVKERHENVGDIERITPEERRLWAEARDLDQALEKSDAIYEDVAATRYLQVVMDKLYPELRGKITVKIVKSPHLNAFALPNGSVYFHIGLLARLENEAQLATVLAHEGAHFVHKHGYKHRETVRNSAAFAAVTAALGIPLVGDLAVYSSIYGYSQDLEREADSMGYVRLVRAGYDPRESYRAFEHLAAEAKALDQKEPFLFASHPKLQERIDSFKTLALSANPSGIVGQQQFLTTTRNCRLAALDGDISMNRYKSVIAALTSLGEKSHYPPEALYHLGEAYRQRGGDNDDSLSEQNYLSAVKQAPGFAPSYRALGIHYLKKQRYELAEKYFARYLQMAPNASDHGYVSHYYQEVKRELARR